MPTYHSASGSVAEDLFIELFSETFGAEKAGYLYSQYHFYDIYQNSRYADFVLENGARRVAIEIDDETSHNKSLVASNKFKQRLVAGEVRFIFVVDIYNEGVDIPEVNTVLFLRPTESLTVFLQQLGRGLRLTEDKECLTVLDFIGQANKKYNFEDKFAALLSNTTRSVTREIKDGFISVPKGCYIQLEKKAAKYILDNIRASYGNAAGLVSRVATFAEDSGMELTLANFLDYYHLDPRAIYKFSSFSRICARADVIEDFEEPLEEAMTKAFARLAVIDSRRWISFLLVILPHLDDVDFAALSDIEKRMLQMFYITVWGKAVEDWSSEEVLDNLYALSDSTTLLGELISLLQYRFEQIDFIDEPVDLGFDCPLDLHCTYTRDQLLVAMDFMKPKTVKVLEVARTKMKTPWENHGFTIDEIQGAFGDDFSSIANNGFQVCLP